MSTIKEFLTQYWLEFIFGLAITVLGIAFDNVRRRLKEQKTIKAGLTAILHDRLFQSGMHFVNKGEIGIAELRNIEKLYKAYHALGGNSTGTEIYERVMDLKIK